MLSVSGVAGDCERLEAILADFAGVLGAGLRRVNSAFLISQSS
jgi:hypothetical protein